MFWIILHYQIENQIFSNKRVFLCRQVENSSLLLFRDAPSGLKMMQNFSLRHRLHLFVAGLKLVLLDKIFQDTLCLIFCFFNFQTYLLRLVPFLFSLFISWVCSYNLSLKGLAVSPVYVSVMLLSSLTAVAWHTPSTGHVAGPFLQLHPGGVGSGWLWAVPY